MGRQAEPATRHHPADRAGWASAGAGLFWVCLRRLLAGGADLWEAGPGFGWLAGLGGGGFRVLVGRFACRPVDLTACYHTGSRGPPSFTFALGCVPFGRWAGLGWPP